MVPSFYIFAYVFPALVSIGMTKAAPKMRTAPEECPLQNGNLIDTILFVEDNEFCENLCSKDEKCLYYFYYAGTGSNDIDVRSQPAQCFLYDECERSVQMATENCPLTR